MTLSSSVNCTSSSRHLTSTSPRSSRRSLKNSAGESFNKRNQRQLSVDLQLTKLEALLTQTAPDFCQDRELADTIRHQFHGLAAQKHFSNCELTRDEINELVDILNLVLQFSPELPPMLVAYVHSTIGLARQLIGDNDGAIGSFTKALWIETSTKNHEAIEIGLTVHRLAICHGRKMNYPEALVMLNKALMIYEVAGLDQSHPYVSNAREEARNLRMQIERRSQKTASSKSSRNIKIKGERTKAQSSSNSRAA